MRSMHDAAIDQILAALTVNVEEFAICQFAADSAIEVRILDKMEVHFVLAGTLHLGLPDGESIEAPVGSVVLVPAGVQQVMGGSAAPSRIYSLEGHLKQAERWLAAFRCDDGQRW